MWDPQWRTAPPDAFSALRRRKLHLEEVVMRSPFSARSWLPAIAVVGTLSLILAGCSGRGELPTAPLAASLVREAGNGLLGERVPEDKPGTHVEYCDPIMPFSAARFSDPLRIDNRFSPLVPGTQYVLTGVANRGLGLLPHNVVFTVTDMVKVIDGVECLVLWDRDFQEGVLAEEELAFFAQDDDGNVWMMGEYPEEFDITSGEYQGAPSTWIAGIEGAVPGTLMLADPKLGTGYYLQARASSVRFLDCAKVFKVGEKDCVPVGCFSDILVTDERAPSDWRGGHQRKYYAPGVGNIRVDFRGDPEGEVLVMTQLRQLKAAEMEEARREVERLDARGRFFIDRYMPTNPVRRPSAP
jgi:hypothetical protein